MIRVQAPSRLHFGLLSLSAEDHWPDRHGQLVLPARRFGGIGLMVQAPGVCLTVRPAAEWSADGPLAERALGFARRFAATVSAAVAQHITVEACAPEHAGLGTGTQLGMAVARALALAWNVLECNAVELGQRVGRGLRSALGIHGFARGGFLVEGGKANSTAIAPLLLRCEFPDAWRIVLLMPAWAQGLHGTRERQAFQRLQDHGATLAATETLCRIALLGLVPALVERDLTTFGEALYDFNARVGEAFASVQGGTYAHPRLAELVAFIRAQGVRGVGQSSWGAAIFAVTANDAEAVALSHRLRERFALSEAEVLVTAACNAGATHKAVH